MVSESKDSRSLIFSDGTSHKFWKIELDGSSHTVSYGRIGTSGQTQTKDFADDASARKSFEKLVAEKVKKGYTGDTASTAASSAAASTPGPDSKTVNSARKGRSTPVHVTPDGESIAAVSDQVSSGPVVTSVNLSHERTIALAPEDWAAIGLPGYAERHQSVVRPFDKDDCLRRLNKLRMTQQGTEVCWEGLKLTSALTREEAHFWLLAMTTEVRQGLKLQPIIDAMNQHTISGQVDVATAYKRLLVNHWRIHESVLLVLSVLLTPKQYAELVKTPNVNGGSFSGQAHMFRLIDGFSRYVVPYVSESELDELKEDILATWDPNRSPGGAWSVLSCRLLSGLGAGFV